MVVVIVMFESSVEVIDCSVVVMDSMMEVYDSK